MVLRWCSHFLIVAFFLWSGCNAWGNTISIQGRIADPSGSWVNAQAVAMKLRILAPNRCILYEETTGPISISEGQFFIELFKGSRSGTDPSLTVNAVFSPQTSSLSGLTCLNEQNEVDPSKTSYVVNLEDGRILRLSFKVGGDDVIADFPIASKPRVLNSLTLNGKTPENLLQVSQGLTQGNVEKWFSGPYPRQILDGTFSPAQATNVKQIVALGNGGTGASSVSGTLAALALGPIATLTPTGTANSSTFLRGDGAWTLPVGTVETVATRKGDVILAPSDFSDFDSAAQSLIDAQKGASGGLSLLDANGKVPASQLALVPTDVPGFDWSKINSGKPTTLSGFEP